MALRLPSTLATWRIADARVPGCLLDMAEPGTLDREGLARVDLTIAGDRIAAIAPAGQSPADPAVPTMQTPGLVMPCFVDAHTHLDKGHIWPRARNPVGSVAGARDTVPADRAANWTAADVRARMEFGLRTAYAGGTRAIRTHLDCVGEQTGISWPVFAALAEEWRGRIELQASPLFGIELALDDIHMTELAAAMDECGGRCLGAVAYPGPALRPGLERLFRLAADKGWDLDVHADETDDPSVNALSLIAELALAFRFEGRILVGHCCTLSLMPEEECRRTIEHVAEAGL